MNQLKRQESAEDARERALRGSKLVQGIALRGLLELHNSIRPVENPPANLLRFWKEGTEMEFVALGLPINVIREQVEAPSPEQVEEQERIEMYQRARRAFGNGR